MLNCEVPLGNETYEGPVKIVVVYGNSSGSTDFGRGKGVSFPKLAVNVV